MTISMMPHPLAKDLDFILEHTKEMWQLLRDEKIFITGGTGFFGTWLLESLLWINEKLNLNINATVLTRSPAAYAKKCPHLFERKCINFLEGDIKNFVFPREPYSYLIHAATDASAALNDSNPIAMFDTIVQGTQHVLEFAKHAGVKQTLFISSGAVYGKQPESLTHLTEDYSGVVAWDQIKSAYAVGKLSAEYLCHLYGNQYKLDIKIARCFAFVGPYLPLDVHFAIGNFIRDGLRGHSIQVNGDGTPYRSYLYAADLMIWLWTILWKGVSLRPYNVGSDEAVTIAQLANIVASTFSYPIEVKIATEINLTKPVERYVPDITRARKELSLKPRVSLVDSIRLTSQWYKERYVK